MKHRLNHWSHGFTLVEIMVSMGIVSILSLTIAQMMAYMSRSMAGLQQQADLVNLQQAIAQSALGGRCPITTGTMITNGVQPIQIQNTPFRNQSTVRLNAIDYTAFLNVSNTYVTVGSECVWSSTLYVVGPRSGNTALSTEKSPTYLQLHNDCSGRTTGKCSLTNSPLPPLTIPDNTVGAVNGGSCSEQGLAVHDSNGIYVCTNGAWVLSQSQMAARCGAANGTPYTANGVTFCRIPAGSCPTGLNQFGSWSTTGSNSCSIGSTTGCAGQSAGCTTGSHVFSNSVRESCTYNRVVACGPATQSASTCFANIYEIGCI